jgi:predicted metalloprotease
MTPRDRCLVSGSTMPVGGDVAVSLRAQPLLGAGHDTNQQMSAPSRRGREGQGYKIPFPAVVHDLNAYWQRAFSAVGVSCRAPAVKPIEAPVVTACGLAGPEDLERVAKLPTGPGA